MMLMMIKEEQIQNFLTTTDVTKVSTQNQKLTEPDHKHTPPMFYYILQGQPLVTLDGIKNRTKKWQCVNIPSLCPHAIHNDTNEEVVVLWNYVSLTDKIHPDKNFNWVWLGNGFDFKDSIQDSKTCHERNI